jgi:hypothetical protein
MFIRDARLHVHQYMYVSETFLELTWIGKLDKTTPAPTAKTAKAAPPKTERRLFSLPMIRYQLPSLVQWPRRCSCHLLIDRYTAFDRLFLKQGSVRHR